MIRHFFKLGFIPTCNCMHVAVFVSHKFKVADWNGNRFRPNSEKSANVNNYGASNPRTMNVINGANFLIVDTYTVAPSILSAISSSFVKRT
jgi:hypothetical protein